jgi:hypothetical protein
MSLYDLAFIRRYVRALIRQHDISCEPGDCAEACNAISKLIPDARVVQGHVYYTNHSMKHVWLIWRHHVIDPTMLQFRLEMNAKTVPVLGVWETRQACPFDIIYVVDICHNIIAQTFE